MKRILISILVLIIYARIGCAQDVALMDSLKKRLSIERTDSVRIKLMNQIATNYRFAIPDSLFIYANQALKLSKTKNNHEGEVNALLNLVIGLRNLGNDSKAFQIALKAIKLAEEHHLLEEKGLLLIQTGTFYKSSRKYNEAFERFREAKMLFDSIGNYYFSVTAMLYIADVHEQLKQYDSALYYGYKALDVARVKQLKRVDRTSNFLGRIYIQKGEYDSARIYLLEEVSESDQSLYERNYNRASLFYKLGKTDSAIKYGKKALESGLLQHSFSSITQSSRLLSQIYEAGNKESSLQYLKMAVGYQDSILNLGKLSALEGFSEYDEQERKSLIESEKQAYIQKIRLGALLFGFLALGCIAILLFRNYRKEKNAKNLIHTKNTELETAMARLKTTQSQLIQSEKMASLGELTAGIAHEIQNPLNFVNNFSELSTELIEEMNAELNKGDLEEAKVIALDVKQNLEKINHHGKRADNIVKGMLQHSKSSSGKKEATDINVLCDEYLRLAYHGLRAKDKSFNAKFETDFDAALPKVSIVPQDIGRVILNLINNAFYSVSEKSKQGIPDFEPIVTISTTHENESNSAIKGIKEIIKITVKDNGNGIPDSIKEKIFQPFFTTKPTGQGTGLGLSLSYDIVKAHGGELRVETKGDQGSTFIIELPSS